MRALRISQAFDRRHVLVCNRPQWRIACAYGVIADHDIARAAFAGATAEMRAGHPLWPAQDREQRCVGIGVDLGIGAIEAETNAWHEEVRILIATACREIA